VLLYKAGFIYRGEREVFFDPVSGTTLAHEQVDASGKAERTEALVERKLLSQWFFKTSALGSDLHTGLQDLL
jgi:leucyl-tRNA synthetase